MKLSDDVKNHYYKIGKLSVKKRLSGMTKEQVSNYMARVRAKKTIK